MKLTPEVLLGFSKAYLNSNFDNPLPTPQFHIDLWSMFCREDKRVAAAAPRGCAKSTAVTHTCSLASALFRDKDHIMIVSDTEGQAKGFLKDIAMELTENEELVKDFHINGLMKDTESELICSIGEDKHLFRIIAKGSNQKVRGIKWRGKRPDLIIGDDLENDEIVMNAERRLKFKQWFFGALMPCLSDKGVIRIVGTILHMDSLLETLMPASTTKYPVINLPLVDYTKNPKAIWKSMRFRAHDPDYTNLLWPDKLSEEELKIIKSDYEAQGFPDGYAQEYLNYPIDEGSAYFKRHDIKPMKDDDWNKPMKYYVGGDFAISTKTHADFTAFAVVGVDSEGDLFIVDVLRGRWDTFQIVEKIFEIYDNYKPDLFLFEKGQVWSALEPVFLKEAYKPGQVRYVNYDTVATSQDKKTRNRALQHSFRSEKIKVDSEASWYNDLLLELVRFPKGAHDDMVDALGHITAKILKLQEAPTMEQINRKHIDDDLKRSRRMFMGRCKATGY